MSRTSICRQHRRPNTWHRTNGRRYFADGYFAEDKLNPMSAVWNRSRMEPFSFGAYRPLTSPDLLDVRGCKCLKRMAGTTGLEPAASAVTGQHRDVTYWILTVLTARS